MSRVDLEAGLCGNCQKVLKTLLKDRRRGSFRDCRYLRTGEAVLKAAEAGCRLCRTVYATVRRRLSAMQSSTSVIDLQSLGYALSLLVDDRFLIKLSCDQLPEYIPIHGRPNTGDLASQH